MRAGRISPDKPQWTPSWIFRAAASAAEGGALANHVVSGRSLIQLLALLLGTTAICEGAAATKLSSQPEQELSHRPRVIIETDAGGDPDDEQSLVRFLVYANEFDVEGIIASRPKARDGENRNPERTGLGIARRMLNAYAQCYTNLVKHDPRYPGPEQLWMRTVAGYDTDGGVDLVIEAVEAKSERPVWFCNWGTDQGSAQSCLLRALDKIQRERGASGYAVFKQQLRLASADKFGAHATNTLPSFPLWVDTFRPELQGKRWYHRFSALTAKAGGFDIERDVRNGHGPLGQLYPTNTTHWLKEGDSMTFLYLVPNGLNVPEQPGWGGWAGRYGRQPGYPGKPYFWANQIDVWQGSTNRDNTLRRWAEDLQNDFRMRMDWCVKEPTQANHPPRVTVNEDSSQEPLLLTAQPGAEVTLDAAGSTDPDGDTLRFDWFVYPEAGTYGGPVELRGTNTARAVLHVPNDAQGSSLHVIVAVTDSGKPPIRRYRRVVVAVPDNAQAARTIAPLFQSPSEYADKANYYRSPLLFKDGTDVRTPQDWNRRKAEIANEWTKAMGPWPALLENPKLEVLGSTRRGELLQKRVRVPLAPEQTGEGWLLSPPGNGPFPAVLVVYYEPETSVGLGTEGLRDFGFQLAQRGFVTLSIGTPGGNAWKPATGAAICQPLSYHAYVAANCWKVLAQLEFVDAKRIGVVGHSYGGKWAMFAGALWDKFAAVAVSDPGIVFDETRPNVNYWEPWYLGLDLEHKRSKAGVPTAENPRTGAYKQLVEAGHDLHELHAMIAPRPFFVSGGSEDPSSRWLALHYTVELNRILGFTNRVAMSNRPAHSPTEESNAQLYAFFEYFLGRR